MKTVLTYGTFDLFHHGHVRLLKRLRLLGDKLVVGLSTDEFNKRKGKVSVISYNHRKEILESVRYVDYVFPENSWEQKIEDIKREKADIFAIGDDWAGRFDHLQKHVNVVYLARTEDISTTDLKTILSALDKDKIYHLRNSLIQAISITDKMLK